MPNVFIIQEPVRRDLATGHMVPVMDFRKVLEYGNPIVCLPTGRVGLTPGPTVDALREKLKGYSADDYIVAVGDPTAMFAAAMVLGDLNNGRCNLLKWDKESKRYICVQLDIHHRTRKGEN